MENSQDQFFKTMTEGNSELTNKTNPQNGEQLTNHIAENTLSKIASIVLWVGFIGSIIMFIVVFTSRYNDWSYLLLVSAITIFIVSIIQWALLKVIVNISINLFNINATLKREDKKE